VKKAKERRRKVEEKEIMRREEVKKGRKTER